MKPSISSLSGDSYDGRPETLEAVPAYLLNAHYIFSVDSREEFLLLFHGKLLFRLQTEAMDEIEES
jgi:hypothetical protein